ncbi:hypothetical protein BGZ76_008982 [Entomortierella beljakovae]|nr:hypothetical protein BGZ76_008982 [Entomortierella beljakovae]
MVIPSELLANKGDPWDVELWTRNYGFAGVIETHRPNEGDWLILSDVDEIPRRSTVAAMKDPSLSRYPGRLFGDGTAGSGGDLFRFGCQFYYYSYEYRHEGGLWNGPVIVRFRELDSPKLLKQRSEAQRVAMLTMVRGKWKEAGSLLRDYRNGDQATYVDDSCIHCSWCFSNITQVINKMESYSHGEHNQEKYKVQDWIIEKYRNGEDLFERDADKFDYVENNLDLPHYVQEHKDRFMYMLSRRGMDGGFVDVTIKSE